ncbi:MAG: hypothetical protein WB565_02425 [Acidimicrobiales bacterium]
MKDAPFATDAPSTKEPPPVRESPPVRGARQLQLPLAASEANARRSSRSRAPRRPRPSPSAAEFRTESRRPSATPADSARSSDGAYRRLDERTRRVGLEGIAAARAVLEHGGRVDAAEQSCRGRGRAA